jgi:ribosomal protein S21
MAIYAVRKGSESNDRLMNRFKKQVQESRLIKKLRDCRRYKKKGSKRLIRKKALKREWYRGKNTKQKFYSNM